MTYKAIPCTTVGAAYMVVRVDRFGREKILARGLTQMEATFYVKRLRTK